MAENRKSVPPESTQQSLQDVIDLLHRQRLVEDLVHRQDMPKHDLVESLVHKQNIAALRKKLDQMHPADVAYILEALPLDERLTVWDLVKAERDGEILLEASDAVRETLIAHMDSHELVAAAESLDTDEIADLAPDLPRDVIQDVLEAMDEQNRAHLQSALSFPEDTVGALMDFEMVTIRADIAVEVALRYLRRVGDLPDQTDKIFVVDRDDILIGVVPLKHFLINNPDTMVGAIMVDNPVILHPREDAGEAANAFERYNLVSAPVVDDNNKLIGRVTIDAVVDFIREESDNTVLGMAGLREEEDLFSTVWKSVQNRGPWLAINLVTAFIASRVIGMFEHSISVIVALAALMPIVAGIGGNSGNQTATLIVRALALGQIRTTSVRKLIAKEAGVGLLNGAIWGSAVGVFAYVLYQSASLAIVISVAMLLNLLIAALAGIVIPLSMHKLGRDPALGSTVLVTATTDSMGFFIFLGLATVFLI